MALSRLGNYILEANGRRAEKDLDYGERPTETTTLRDMDWVQDESVRGALDFKFFIAGRDPKTATNPAAQTLYLAGDQYMNVNTFGNYVWGAYGSTLGLSKAYFKTLAQSGSMIQKRFDEIHEQKAIGLGYDFMYKRMLLGNGNTYKSSYIRK